MSLKRAREYPIKQQFESTDDFAKRLRDSIQEEATDRIKDFDILQLANVPWVDVREYGATGDGSHDDTVAIQAAITSLQSTGGIVLVPHGIDGDYLCSDTITLYSGVTLKGVGKNPVTGKPSTLNFSTNTGATHSLYMDDVIDVNIENLLVAGRSAGSGYEIFVDGDSKRVNLKNVLAYTSGTGEVIRLGGSGGSLIASELHNVVVNAGVNGFFLEAACTSISFYNCIAQDLTSAGYYIQGTYISLHSCAADGNQYGYYIKSGSQVGMYSCGGETSVSTAVLALDSTGISIDAFRSHGNNTEASATYPSFLDIQNTDRMSIVNCRDSSPTAGTVNSINSSSSDNGENIFIVNPNFDRTIHADVDKIRVDNGMYFISGNSVSSGTAVPSTGTYTQGDTRIKTDVAAGASPGWSCTHSGTYGAATDNTGDTDGSTAVITGMADTSDFALGSFVDVTAGFPTTGPYKVLATTATTMTISVNSDSADANITVDTSDPVWNAQASVAA